MRVQEKSQFQRQITRNMAQTCLRNKLDSDDPSVFVRSSKHPALSMRFKNLQKCGNVLAAVNLTAAYFARSRPAQSTHSSQRKSHYLQVWN